MPAASSSVAVAVAATLVLFAASATGQSCNTPSFTLCQPSGSSATTLPSTGNDLAPLYNDLLNSVKGISFRKRVAELYGSDALVSRDSPSLCCNVGTDCVNLQGFNVPMCYDKFTTNYKLANGASGTIDSGDYSGVDGGSANLRNGTFTAGDKSTGNMYSGSGASQSPTNTAAIPTPFTGTGVGSAIPATAVGVIQTLLVTVPGTTIPGTTETGVTQAGTTQDPLTSPSTVPGTTQAGTTRSGRTQGATTVSPYTTLITTNVVGTLPSSTSKAAANGGPAAVDSAPQAALAGFLAALMLL